uniref:CSON000933 protein n=1 Tax=Culicoides sonorensis TaxID=179676 RepID=A0A336MJL1_CULSO
MDICVVGAGVIGLTTALELQKEYRNANITIIADKVLKDTTSDVAAGIFRPGISFSGPTPEITNKWLYDAYHHWDDLRKSSDASQIGVTELSGYIFSSRGKDMVRNHFMEKLCPKYRSVTEEELELCPGDWKYGSFFTTLLTDNSLYLPYALNKFKQQGGIYTQSKLNTFSDLDNKFNVKYDVVVNCTGLGAKYLCNDYKLVPIRGQVFKVNAPWIKMAFFGDYDTYIIPGFRAVTLGGCRNFDSYDETWSKYDGAAIKERCEGMLPSLRKADVVAQRVGLRPHRDPVRVEIEFQTKSDGSHRKIVHNYGHGGYGVLSAPGTSIHAVKLVGDVLKGLDENESDINAALQQLEDTFDTRSEASDTSEKGDSNKNHHNNNDSSMSSVSSGGSSPKAKRRHKSGGESKSSDTNNHASTKNKSRSSASPDAKKQKTEGGSKSGKSYDYMTKLNYLFRDARFYVIKSNNADNVTLSKTKGVWATLPQNEANLNRAFKECRNVLLIFSVKESGKFAGFARMSCESKRGPSVDWVLPPGISAKALGGTFDIDWICKKELSFTCTTHLYNPWNEGKPVKIGRDGQEIEPKVAQELCKLFPEDDSIEMLPILKKSKESGRILREKGIKPVINRRPPMMSRNSSSRGGRDNGRGGSSRMTMRGGRKFMPGRRPMNGGPPFKKPPISPYSRDNRMPGGGKMPRYPSTTAAAEAYVADYMRQMQHHQLPPMPYAPPPGFPQLLEALPPALPRYYDGSLSADYPGSIRPPPPPSFFTTKSSADHRSNDRPTHHRNNDYNNSHRSDKERNSDRIPGQKRKLERSGGSDWNNHRNSDNNKRNYRGRR